MIKDPWFKAGLYGTIITICICLVMIAIIVDSQLYLKKIDLDPKETINWISEKLDINDNEIGLPSMIKIIEQDELNDYYINHLPGFEKDMQERLAAIKAMGLRQAGLYDPRDNSIRLSRDLATKEIFVHELTHHVLNNYRSANKIQNKISKRNNELEEEVADLIGKLYVKEHRWSVRLLYNLDEELKKLFKS